MEVSTPSHGNKLGWQNTGSRFHLSPQVIAGMLAALTHTDSYQRNCFRAARHFVSGSLEPPQDDPSHRSHVAWMYRERTSGDGEDWGDELVVWIKTMRCDATRNVRGVNIYILRKTRRLNFRGKNTKALQIPCGILGIISIPFNKYEIRSNNTNLSLCVRDRNRFRSERQTWETDFISKSKLKYCEWQNHKWSMRCRILHQIKICGP